MPEEFGLLSNELTDYLLKTSEQDGIDDLIYPPRPTTHKILALDYALQIDDKRDKSVPLSVKAILKDAQKIYEYFREDADE